MNVTTLVQLTVDIGGVNTTVPPNTNLTLDDTIAEKYLQLGFVTDKPQLRKQTSVGQLANAVQKGIE